MNEAVVLFLFLTSVYAGNNDEDCKIRFLSKSTSPTRLNVNVTALASSIISNLGSTNSSELARQTFSFHHKIFGLIIKSSNERILALNITRRLKIFPNKTIETDVFWKSFENSTNGWIPAFKDCHFLRGDWFYGFVASKANYTTAIFLKLDLNQCDDNLEEIFGGRHRCEDETTYCVPHMEVNEKKGAYHCLCRHGFFYPEANLSWKGFAGEDIENGVIDSAR